MNLLEIRRTLSLTIYASIVESVRNKENPWLDHIYASIAKSVRNKENPWLDRMHRSIVA